MKKTLLMLVVIFISLYSHSQSPFLNFRIPEESNKRIIGYSSSNKINVFLNIKYQSCNTLIQYFYNALLIGKRKSNQNTFRNTAGFSDYIQLTDCI